jgi:hypothetical protein
MPKQSSSNPKKTKEQARQTVESRVAVLLQRKDRETADDLSRLIMTDPNTKADKDGGDTDMKGA